MRPGAFRQLTVMLPTTLTSFWQGFITRCASKCVCICMSQFSRRGKWEKEGNLWYSEGENEAVSDVMEQPCDHVQLLPKNGHRLGGANEVAPLAPTPYQMTAAVSQSSPPSLHFSTSPYYWDKESLSTSPTITVAIVTETHHTTHSAHTHTHTHTHKHSVTHS